ncbi:MAG: alpha-amylase family glycosyl hydrolase, partial [Bacteroidota bacterium]
MDPPNWWAGMHMSTVELLISGDNAGAAKLSTKGGHANILSQKQLDHPDYLVAEIEFPATAGPSDFELILSWGKIEKRIPYSVKSRTRNWQKISGVTAEDFIYLIMPDRFANGDPKNDVVKGLNEAHINRDSMYHRHGGDLQGIIDHLDYLEDLGVTALWINPVQENDQPKTSYHGYAITDHYRIDPRFGDNALYKKLVDACHKRGMKMIMDVIYNHWGDQHYLQRKAPSPDFIHQQDKFQRTSYRAPTLLDPYASEKDRKIMTDGWFDVHMPDLNQKNPHLAKYLIQNSIWWIEYAGLDGFRIDTYAYSDQDFMQDLLKAIQREYPKFGIFGETWVHGAPVQAFFAENKIENGSPSTLPGVTDFQLYYALNEALTKPMGWTEGISRMYFTLAKDYLYKDPYRNVLFLDNHDLSRFYSVIGEDPKKF